jgi:large subunit ribosomal protein L18
MIQKKTARLRRARQTRAKLAELKAVRLTVHRSNFHIYAQLIDGSGKQVLATASSLEPELRSALPNGGNVKAAAAVGKRIAERARDKGIEKVAFDRAGYKFHGRVKALAEAAREAGLKF